MLARRCLSRAKTSLCGVSHTATTLNIPWHHPPITRHYSCTSTKQALQIGSIPQLPRGNCYLSAESALSRNSQPNLLRHLSCCKEVHKRCYSTVPSDPNEFLITRPGIKAKIIDGKKMSERVREEVARQVETMVTRGKRPPKLVAVLVGDDPASRTYVSHKTKAAKKCGIQAASIVKESSISQEELLELIDGLNRNDEVDGVLVQLPLPEHIDEKTICNAVAPEKDVDGFHILNIGKYCAGEPRFIPATPLGVLEILKRCNVTTFGKNVCIAGRSKNIGFTLGTLLHSDGTGDATTILCHRYTPPEQLPVMMRLADIVIVATGVTGLIKGDMVKEGATVIDIGITRVKQPNGSTKLVGDVVFEEVAQVASLITPVPGGVGPMTVAMLMKNTLSAAQKNFTFDFQSIKDPE